MVIAFKVMEPWKIMEFGGNLPIVIIIMAVKVDMFKEDIVINIEERTEVTWSSLVVTRAK